MRSLVLALQDHELTVLRVIGEWWELDLTGSEKATAVKLLSERMAQIDIVLETEYLPSEESAAVQALVAQGGRVAVAAFEREHGALRMMGPGRMEREEPWYDPLSATEALWYRGFLYRAFDKTTDDLLEYYYLPDEMMAQFPQTVVAKPVKEVVAPFQPIAAPPEYNQAVTDAVDDLTTLLAIALKTTLQPQQKPQLDALLLNPDPERRSLLLTLAQEMGLVKHNNGRIRPTRKALEWLKRNRERQLQALAEAWSNSDWNDLCHTPELECEGEGWNNDPLLARTALLDVLPRTEDWFRVWDLAAHIKTLDPDFQRPDGNYDTWYIRDAAEQNYLAGFDSWDQVEGRLLQFMVLGPMYWLGMVETAVADDAQKNAYRLTSQAINWLTGQLGTGEDELQTPLVVQPDGSLLAGHNVSRYQRFQAARIGDPQPLQEGKPYVYRLTPSSLTQAREQGITVERLLQFMVEASGRAVPKSVQRAIARWAEQGVEGRLETAVILRVSDAAILDTLRSNPKTRDFIGESLGDFAVTIKREQWQKFCAATTQLGLLLDMDL